MSTGNLSSWVSQSAERVTGLVSEIIRPYEATVPKNFSVELHDILMDTGKHMFYELEDECVLLERMVAPEESKYQTNLQECLELKRIERLRNAKLVSELDAEIDRLKIHLLKRDDKIHSYQERVSFLEKRIAEREKELKVLKDEKLASDWILEEMRLKEVEAKHGIEKLRLEKEESSENVKKYWHQMLEARMEKVTLEGIVEKMRLKETETNHAMEEQKHKFLESSRNAEEFRCQMLAAEIKKTGQELVVEEMKGKEFEAGQSMEKLRRQNTDLCDVINKLNNRVLAFESEIMKYAQIVKEMKREAFQAGQTVEELRRENSKVCDENVVLSNSLLDIETRVPDIEKKLNDLRLNNIEAKHEMEKLRLENREYIDNAKKLNCQKLSAEQENMRCKETIQEMKRKQLEAHQIVEELSKQLEAHQTVEELRTRDIVGLKNRISAFEKEKTRYEEIIEEMRRKQMDADQGLDKLTHESLRAFGEVQRIIVKASKEIKEAKNANTSFSKGEKQTSGNSISAERAGNNIMLQIETVEAIDRANEAIHRESASNLDVRQNLGEQKKSSPCPSSQRSGLPTKRKRSPRANGHDDISNQRTRQVPIPTHDSDGSSGDLYSDSDSSFCEPHSEPDDDSCSDGPIEKQVREVQREQKKLNRVTRRGKPRKK